MASEAEIKIKTDTTGLQKGLEDCAAQLQRLSDDAIPLIGISISRPGKTEDSCELQMLVDGGLLDGRLHSQPVLPGWTFTVAELRSLAPVAEEGSAAQHGDTFSPPAAIGPLAGKIVSLHPTMAVQVEYCETVTQLIANSTYRFHWVAPSFTVTNVSGQHGVLEVRIENAPEAVATDVPKSDQ